MSDMREDRCETCTLWVSYPEICSVTGNIFYRHAHPTGCSTEEPWGWCHLFPNSIHKNGHDFCGQWRIKK